MEEKICEEGIINSFNADEKQGYEPQINSKKCNRNRLIIGISLLVLLVFGLIVFCFGYIPRTPEYALYKAFKAMKIHNYELASYYVNVDKIAENTFQKVKEEALEDPDIANNPFSGLAIMFIDSLLEPVKTAVKAGFKDVVEDSRNVFTDIPDIKVIGFLIVKFYDNVSLVKDMSVPNLAKFQLNTGDNEPVIFYMSKYGNTWQIVDITGYTFLNNNY